ncbi:hypothetical protein [Sandarakinorhabdus sp.]|uniref:hypothetical protein n=1 Tax=Sandarakinorhabdus sp. TaxID=1916663 RepID=UPI00286DA7DE|nr:hypothetical protein [Sandarakinorhabdus sp.]
MSTGPSFLLGLMLAAGLSLIVGGIWLIRQPGSNRVKAGLMMVAGLVVLFNAWVQSLPLPAAAA